MANLFKSLNKWFGYLFASVGVIGIAAVLSQFSLRVNSTAVALAFLLVVLMTATFFGSRPAFLASILGVLAFNFFFLPPLYTLTISDPQNWIAFGAFLITAIVAGQLSSYARRHAEEAENRQKEVERLYGELQNAFKKASQAEAFKQSEKLKSALLDAVTHDLRTPLTSIKASVTTLLEDAKNTDLKEEDSIVLDNESRAEFLEIINEETDRLNKFIGGMVDLARIEAGKIALQKSWSDVEKIIRFAIERAKNRLKNYHIIIELERDFPLVRVNSDSIAEVIYNLLDNAAKYSSENSKIKIAVKRAGNEMFEIAVSDQGKGISAEMREKVFEKFHRVYGDDIHTTSSGLGLGLAIAKGIIESRNGRIWIEDGSENFTTKIAFQLPIGDDED